MARVLERSFRRSGLPLTYSEGFSPRPKLHFGLALSVGYESMAEYLDVDLVNDMDVDLLPGLLSPCLPVGIDVSAAAPIERSVASLQEAVVACDWQMRLFDTPAGLAQAIQRALGADELLLERTRKSTVSTDNVRPAIESISMHDDVLFVRLVTAGRGLRPSEFLQALLPERSADDLVGHVLRTHQWIEVDGIRVEPIPNADTELRTLVRA